MRNSWRGASILLLASLSCNTLSSADEGRILARQCSVCHGKTGIGTDPEVPNLAGQSAFYLEKSMKDYRGGVRQDRRMSLIAQNLSDDDIKALAAWYESIEITATVPD